MLRCVNGFGESLLVACCLLAGALQAQDLGGLPSKLDWRVLEADSVRLITTPKTQSFAERALAIDQALLQLQPVSLGTRVEPIDVVVQPTTVVSNGFVGLEPYRSYLYAQAPQQQRLVSTNAWVDALAIHEYRHVEQFNNLNRGWTRFADFVFGDGGRGVMIGLSTPNWFFEGDAVYYESALTYAGRGRTPAFTALQRAQAREGIQYRYAKARNGSLRSRVPDHYPLGYAMVAHGRHAYGDPWPQVVRGAGTFWPPVYPFSLALKRVTGKHTPAFYRETYDSLATVWNARTETLQPLDPQRLTPLGGQLPIYSAPLPTGLDTGRALVALRSSQVRPTELVTLSESGRAKRLTQLGPSLDGSLSYANERAVWTELRFNPTRPNETYSVLMRYDLSTRQKVQLTEKTKLFSPGLSPDGNTIVAVEARVGQSPTLVYYAANSGQQIGEQATPYEVLAWPRFTPDGGAVVALVKVGGFVSYARFDGRGDAAGQLLLPWTRHTLGVPFVYEGHVFFSASYTGIDNIFRVALDGNQSIEQLTQAAVSATQPAVAAGDLVYVEVAAAGDPIVRLAQNAWLGSPHEVVEPVDLPQYAALNVGGSAAAFRDQFYERIPATGITGRSTQAPSDEGDRASVATARTRPYSGLLRGFTLYTLQPLANQTEASLNVFGGNLLGDLSSKLTAGYNLNEERGFGSATVTLARTYPWVTANFGLAERAHNQLVFPGDTSAAIQRVEYEQRQFGLALSAPLDQQTGTYRLSFTPRLGVQHYQFGVDGGEQLLPGRERLTAVEGDVQLQWLLRQAPKHILPRGGFTLDAQYRRSADEIGDQQLAVNAGLLLPGVLRSHSVYLQARARFERATNDYQFPDFFRYARGTEKPLHDRAYGLSVDYHLPLLYPDVGFAGLVYVRRLRAAAWADYTSLELPERFTVRTDRMTSVGVDITVDATFFNVQDLPIGVRIPYVIEGDTFGFTEEGLGDVQLLLVLPL